MSRRVVRYRDFSGRDRLGYIVDIRSVVLNAVCILIYGGVCLCDDAFRYGGLTSSMIWRRLAYNHVYSFLTSCYPSGRCGRDMKERIRDCKKIHAVNLNTELFTTRFDIRHLQQ